MLGVCRDSDLILPSAKRRTSFSSIGMATRDSNLSSELAELLTRLDWGFGRLVSRSAGLGVSCDREWVVRKGQAADRFKILNC